MRNILETLIIRIFGTKQVRLPYFIDGEGRSREDESLAGRRVGERTLKTGSEIIRHALFPGQMKHSEDTPEMGTWETAQWLLWRPQHTELTPDPADTQIQLSLVSPSFHFCLVSALAGMSRITLCPHTCLDIEVLINLQRKHLMFSIWMFVWGVFLLVVWEEAMVYF